jgi:hypothetical protein
MRYIETWLKGLGLDYIIPKLKAQGITTPKKLAALSLRDIYEVVGVEDTEDRKKLYFLIRRLKSVRLCCCINFLVEIILIPFFGSVILDIKIKRWK